MPRKAKSIGDIRVEARKRTVKCIQVLEGIANQETAPAAARVAAVNALLDRAWGKAVQSVEMGDPGDFERMSEQEIRDKLARLRAEQDGKAQAVPKLKVVAGS